MALPLRGVQAMRVFLCLAAGYLLSFALRAVNAVIAPSLKSDLGLDNADLGLLSAAFFISICAIQLPMGIWLDRYGPRRTEAAMLVVASAGAAMFALSTQLGELWVARALVGIGVAPCLMAAFKAFRMWFPLAQQGQLASWMLVAGTAGALSATLPVTVALPHIGWRGVFWVLALVLLLVAAWVMRALRGAEALQAARPAPGAAPGGYRQIFSSPYFYRIGVIGLVNNGMFFALQTLWAGPWMTTVLGKTEDEASRILFAFNLALLCAYLLLGWAAPRLAARGWSTHRVIGVGIAGMIIAQLPMLAPPFPAAWLLWLVLALFAPATTLTQAQVGLAFPAALAGRANAAYNMLVFGGAFLLQWGFGVLADGLTARGMAASDAFRATLAVMLLAQAGALAYFALHRARPATHDE